MKTKNHYRDTVYIWLSIFGLPMIGAIICGILLILGGENSHLSFYEQGYFSGNFALSTDFKDLKSLLFVFLVMSLVFNIILFAKERRDILLGSPAFSVVIFMIFMTLAAIAYNYHLQSTSLEIKDETFNYKGIVAVICYGGASVLFTLFLFFYGILRLLPAAKKADKINFSKLLNSKNTSSNEK